MITDVEFLEKLDTVLVRPAMFGVQKIEDIQIIFFTEFFLNKNESVEKWSGRFSDFVIKDANCDLNNFHWSKIIRLHSGSDAHSLELFKQLREKFSDFESTQIV